MPNKVGVQPYALFMFCGILPWTWFSTSLSDAAGSLISGGNLIKKVLFPAEVLPIVSVLANMVHFFLGLPILVLFLILFRPPTPWHLLWFPVAVVIQLVFTAALALFVAALAVHFRDIRDILANVLTLWFFATPIIYPWFQPGVQRFKLLFNANPFTHLAVSYQEILLPRIHRSLEVAPDPWVHVRGSLHGVLLAGGSSARLLRRCRLTTRHEGTTRPASGFGLQALAKAQSGKPKAASA